MIINIIGFYLLGSLIAVLMVFNMYNEDFDNLKTIDNIIKNNPEAKIVFIIAGLFSWLYVLFFGIAKLKDCFKR